MSNTDFEEHDDHLIEDDGQHGDDDAGAGGVGSDAEERARRLGWIDKDEFDEKGIQGQWRDADEFMRRAEENPNLLRENFSRLERRYGDLERTNNELSTRMGEMSQLMRDQITMNRTQQEEAYQRGLRDLKDKADAAVEDGDVDTYRSTQQKIEEMEKAKPEPAPEVKPAPAADDRQPPEQRVVNDWIADNPWFNDDFELHSKAKEIDAFLARTIPDMGERLKKVSEKVREMHPDKFGNPRRRDPAAAAQPGRPRNRGNGAAKSFSDLPEAAKEICDRLVANAPPKSDGKPYTRTDYVKDYFGEEA